MTTPSEAKLIAVEGLTLTLQTSSGPIPLVSDVSFSIERGEKFGLVGERGSGKSLIALSLIRLLPPAITATGSIRLEGRELLDLPEPEMHRVRGAQISMIFQEPVAALNPVFNLESQITAAVRAHAPMSRNEARERAIELLTMVGLTDAERRLGFYPHQLSGGQCQRVMIAMAMASGSRLLIADEPTTSLDVTVQEEIIKILEALAQDSGISILFISHDLGVVARLCNRIAVAYSGHLLETGTAAALLRTPAHPYTRDLVNCVPNLGEIGVLRRGIPGAPPLPGTWPSGCRFETRCSLAEARCSSPQVLSPLPENRAVRCWKASEPSIRRPISVEDRPASAVLTVPVPQPLVEVRNLSVSYQVSRKHTVNAVSDVSFDIARGSTFALIGESGSGKSTVARAICGLGPISSGSIILDGVPLAGKEPAKLAGSRGVQVVTQDPGAALDPRWPLWRSIVEPRLTRFPCDHDEGRSRAGDLLERVGLSRTMIERRPHQLSGGQRQRVTIARALSPGPQMIILDEAVSALDVSVRNEILALLSDLQREMVLTYLLISHDIGAVSQISSDVGVLYLGKLVEIGSATKVLGRPQHAYTRTLLDAVPTLDGQRAGGRLVPAPRLTDHKDGGGDARQDIMAAAPQ